MVFRLEENPDLVLELDLFYEGLLAFGLFL